MLTVNIHTVKVIGRCFKGFICSFNINFKSLYLRVVSCNTLWVFSCNLILKIKSFGVVIALKHFKILHLHIQIHFFFDVGIAGCKHLNFSIGKSRLVNIFNGTNRGFACHYLTDKLLLCFHELIQICIKGILGYISVQMNGIVFVTLPNRSSCPLFKVGRTPRAINIM